MPNITLHIPDEMDRRMKQYPHLKWTQIIRDMIDIQLKELEEAEMRSYALARLGESEGAEELFEF